MDHGSAGVVPWIGGYNTLILVESTVYLGIVSNSWATSTSRGNSASNIVKTSSSRPDCGIVA